MGKVKDILRGRFRIAPKDTGIPKGQQLAPLGRPLTPAEQRLLEGRNVDHPEPEVRKLTSIPISEPRTKRPPPIIDAEVSDVPVVREPNFYPPARPKKRGWFAKTPERQVPTPYVDDSAFRRVMEEAEDRLREIKEAQAEALRAQQAQEKAEKKAAREQEKALRKIRAREEAAAEELRKIQARQARQAQRQARAVAVAAPDTYSYRAPPPPPTYTKSRSRGRKKCDGFCWLPPFLGILALGAYGQNLISSGDYETGQYLKDLAIVFGMLYGAVVIIAGITGVIKD